MHEMASLATYNFKIFVGSIPLHGPPTLDWPFGGFGPHFNLCLCYVLFDACENFCQEL